jgi:hypothetical protein
MKNTIYVLIAVSYHMDEQFVLAVYNTKEAAKQALIEAKMNNHKEWMEYVLEHRTINAAPKLTPVKKTKIRFKAA